MYVCALFWKNDRWSFSFGTYSMLNLHSFHIFIYRPTNCRVAMATFKNNFKNNTGSIMPSTMGTRVVYTAKAFFDPLNMIPVFLNILVFMCVQIVFFWFVASRAVLDAFADKAKYIHDLAQRDPVTNASMLAYLTSESAMVDIPKMAAEQKRQRDEENLRLVFGTLGPPIGFALGMLIFFFLVMLVRGKKFTSVDLLLISLVLFAYSTELVFFFVLVKNYMYLGDVEFLNSIVDPSTFIDINFRGMFQDFFSEISSRPGPFTPRAP